MEQLTATDFSLKEDHHRIMREAGCDIERIIDFRRDVH